MFGLSVLSHLGACALSGALAALLLSGWRGGAIGLSLIVASAVNAAWSLYLALSGPTPVQSDSVLAMFEVARYGAWLVLLLAATDSNAFALRTIARVTVIAAVVHTLLGLTLLYDSPAALVKALDIQFALQAMTTLLLVGHACRSADGTRQYVAGALCIGLGTMFAYDAAMFTGAAAFDLPNDYTSPLRGIVNALAVPFVALAARRNRSWAPYLFVSRKIVFLSGTLVAMAIGLVGIVLASYYLRERGYSVEAALAGCSILLAYLFFGGVTFSRRALATTQVFIAKYFYRSKYEYRDEWLRLTRTLAHDPDGAPLRERVVRAMSQIVGASSGILWLCTDQGSFVPVAGWNARVPSDELRRDDPFLDFLTTTGWIIDTQEHTRAPERYDGLEIPLKDLGAGRSLIVPILQQAGLQGFVVLHEPAKVLALNYEDYDLLRTAGQQAASYLAEAQANEQLAQSRQFEAYNQLTAFIMHDLKNLIAQQSMLVHNATKYKNDPRFVEDTVRTIANSVQRMQNLLDQLRHRTLEQQGRPVDLVGLIVGVAERCGARKPTPVVRCEIPVIRVSTDADQLSSVLGNLVRNAQEATDHDGVVRIELSRSDRYAVLRIVDNGVGMSAEFVRERLFRPFDTTKGSKGMGIGAYHAREFVRGMGGEFRVDSEPGQGTKVTVMLPEFVELRS